LADSVIINQHSYLMRLF